MPQFSLAGLTEQSTEIKALKRELEKGTGQTIVSVELDKKLKKIDDVATRGVSLFFEQGQSLYIVFRKNGDQIQIQQNGKKIPFSGMLNYGVDVKLFNLSVKELASYIREYQLKFDKLQERKKLKQIDASIAKTERQRKIAVTTQIKQLTELSASLDSEINAIMEQNTLLESEVLQLEQQKQEPVSDVGENVIQDEPIVLNGDEFGYNENMPIDELREKAIAHLESIRKNIKFVDVPALKVKEENTQVEIRERGIKHIKTFSPNPEKLLILAQIEKLLKTSKYLYTWDNAKTTKKPTVQLYHYLTNTFEWKGEKLTCVIVIEKDNKGLLHYDVLMNKYAQKHLDKAKEMVENLTSKKNPRNSQPSNEHDNQLDGLSQDDFDDDMILDSANSSKGVLNLFIFDKDGNLIDDSTSVESVEPIQNDENTPQTSSQATVEEVELFTLGRHTYTKDEQLRFYLSGHKYMVQKRDDGIWEIVGRFDTMKELVESYPQFANYENVKPKYELPNYDESVFELTEYDFDKNTFTLQIKEPVMVAGLTGYEQHYYTMRFGKSKESDNYVMLNFEVPNNLSKQDRNDVIDEFNDKGYEDFIANDLQGAVDVVSKALLELKGQVELLAKNQSDVDFLNDIIAGKVDVLADDFAEKFESVVERLDEQYPELTKQAVEYYIAKTDEYAQVTA